ncbi:MAG: CBS domain-containing protein [Candidatus Altiarchaeota archaeon]
MAATLQLKDVKSKKIPHLEKNISAYGAAQVMIRDDATTVAVLDGNVIAGTVCERDIISKVVLQGRDPRTTTLGEIMEKDVHYIDAQKTTVDAARMMRDLRVSMIIVTENKQARGTITAMDIVDMYPALQLRLGGQ